MIIYLITNKTNNKKYIGKTTKNIQSRFQSHINSAKYGSPSHLHRAIRKYGQENFSYALLEGNIENEKKLNEREIFWIEKENPEYNMTRGGEGSSGRIFSKDTLQKMSLKSKSRKRSPHSKETKEKIANALKGVSLTEERKRNISASKMGSIPWNKGKKLKPLG